MSRWRALNWKKIVGEEECSVLDAPFIWIFKHCLARAKKKAKEMVGYLRPPSAQCVLLTLGFWLKDVLINIWGKRRERRLKAILFSVWQTDFGLLCLLVEIFHLDCCSSERNGTEKIARNGNLDEFITKGEKLLTITRDGDRLDKRAGTRLTRHKATTQTSDQRKTRFVSGYAKLIHALRALLLQIKKGSREFFFFSSETTKALALQFELSPVFANLRDYDACRIILLNCF